MSSNAIAKSSKPKAKKRKLSERTLKIQKLNDNFRTTFAGGVVVATSGIKSLCSTLLFEILCDVKAFKNFTKSNDPYGEHDFGTINNPVAGKIFWKIDYYDLNMQYHSEDATDETKTTRVLTIMLAEEY
jgi:Protein of unknown function (DUF3768)